MSSSDKQILINSYVKLKEGYDETDMYRNVSSGATGWVRDRKVDDYGFSMIFIEWDETNPKYAGEMDKWVFENHFEILSEKYDKAHNAERYIEKIRIATDAALASDGFLMITVKRHTGPNNVHLYEPKMFGGELNNESKYVLEAQIAYMASQLFQEYISDTLNAIDKKDNLEETDENESGR
jgi:hypothetical protein